MTQSESNQHAKHADSEGTLRVAMLGKVLAAQAELAAVISELRAEGNVGDNASLIGTYDSQLGSLRALQLSVSSASSDDLAALRREVASTVESSRAAVQQGRSTASASTSASLETSSHATRREVESLKSDLFERRIFDSRLQFKSTEDEAAYRRREAENRRYIEQQLGANTPEGNLNAAGASAGQMLDAHAHGAGTSPEFLPRWNRLVETTQKQRSALRAEGRSTAEFDRRMDASIRAYLATKGLTETEIELAIGSAADPLDAVAPYLKTDKDAKALDESLVLAHGSAASTATPLAQSITLAPTGPVPAPETTTVEDVMATFRAAGVVVHPVPASAEPTHGVRDAIRPAAESGRGTR